MANKTAQVAASKPSEMLERVAICPLDANIGTLGQGTLIGRDSTGYFVKADDTQALTEVMVNLDPTLIVPSADGDGAHKVRGVRGIVCPFKIATLSTDAGARAVYGRWVSALYNDEVQLGAGSYSNWVGRIVGHNSVTEVLVEVIQKDMPASTARCSANVADSAEVENTTNETAFNKKATLNGALLAAGDVIKIRANARVVDNNGSDTLTLKLKVGTQEICATAAVDVADGDIGYFDAEVVVRVAGSSGHLAATGVQALGVPGTVTAKPFLMSDAAEDLSSSLDVTVTATWSAAHADNEVLLENIIVTVIPAL